MRATVTLAGRTLAVTTPAPAPWFLAGDSFNAECAVVRVNPDVRHYVWPGGDLTVYDGASPGRDVLLAPGLATHHETMLALLVLDSRRHRLAALRTRGAESAALRTLTREAKKRDVPLSSLRLHIYTTIKEDRHYHQFQFTRRGFLTEREFGVAERLKDHPVTLQMLGLAGQPWTLPDFTPNPVFTWA